MRYDERQRKLNPVVQYSWQSIPLTCLETLGGVCGPLRLEAECVIRVTALLLVGALLPDINTCL